MTNREIGFLLLTCRLGDPDRKVLSPAQLRTLTQRALTMEQPPQDRELTKEDLVSIGCNRLLTERVMHLLAQEDILSLYLQDGKLCGCNPVTRISRDYPMQLREVLGDEAPGSLWYKGDLSLLQTPMISLVGSRELRAENLRFAQEAGKQAALQGYTLVSGNAQGADREAQDACLAAGGSVVSIVADSLQQHSAQERVLYISEDGFNLPFTAQRALLRNRLIHSMGQIVLVAQCRLDKGGTWNGTVENLRKNRRAVFCFNDGTAAMKELEQRGASLITLQDLNDLAALKDRYRSFL